MVILLIVTLFVLSIGMIVQYMMLAVEREKSRHLIAWVQDRQEQLHELKEFTNFTASNHMEVEAELREQLQHMAERLSTLRVEHNARPEQDRFEKTPDPPEPYSQKLMDFLLAIEYEESRVIFEDDIERLRREGHSDEQIYDILCNGE